jgi:hypothetical protein
MIMPEGPGDAQVGKTGQPKPPDVSEHLYKSAMKEYQARETPKEAVATLDNSAAVEKMFPNDRAKQDAAYRIMMHEMKFPGYPEISQSDSKLFTPTERGAIDKYVSEYKPSEDLAAVDAEAKKLEKMGFPRLQQN